MNPPATCQNRSLSNFVADEGVAQAGRWLSAQRFSLEARVNSYDRRHHNRLVNQAAEPLRSSLTALTASGSGWEIVVDAAPVPGEEDCLDFRVSFRCVRGATPCAAVCVALLRSDWSPDNYVLLPSVAYRGNRFSSRRIPYSPKLYFVQDLGPDKPVIISDVPRLNDGPGISRIQERSGSFSVPCIGFHEPSAQRGFLLFTAQGNSLGDYGLTIEESDDRREMAIILTSPVVRETHSYRICDAQFPSLDVPRDFHAGDTVHFAFRVHAFPAPALQQLFDKFSQTRRALFAPEPRRFAVPFSAGFACLEEKFNRENFVPAHGYYSVGPRTSFLQDWQIGWTGGMISTYPLLFAGAAATQRNVLRNFDWLFPNGLSPAGFFWDAGANGTQWIGGDIRKPHTANWHLIRKSGDAVFYILKQFHLMERLGIAVKPAWRDGLRRVCDALVALWRRAGQFGQFVDSLTGEIRVGGSSSGAIIPAALVLAARYFGEPSYREVAVAAGEKFAREFTAHGISCGGPGDALQNPDSESAYALIESYVALFEATGDPQWRERAADAARQFSTWVVAYDFKFPPASTFARAGIQTTGAVYANTQNKHAAPGICTFSGLALFKLFRATGDHFHLDLLRDIAFGLPQYLAHPSKPLGNAAHGTMCERVNMTDWEGAEMVGETLRLSTWAETTLMLTSIEIPAVYVQPDAGLIVTFDHVSASVVSDSTTETLIRLHNPTAVSATVRLFVETRREALSPLPENYLLNGRTVELAAGDATQISIAKTAPRFTKSPS